LVVNTLIPFELTKVRDVTFITSDGEVRVLVAGKMERILGGLVVSADTAFSTVIPEGSGPDSQTLSWLSFLTASLTRLMNSLARFVQGVFSSKTRRAVRIFRKRVFTSLETCMFTSSITYDCGRGSNLFGEEL
jgi:hypothetical protein